MEQVNEILEKVKKETVDTNIKHTFRLSFMYSLKAIVFLVIIISLFVLNIAKFSKKHMLQYVILVVIVVYIIYYMYKLIKYRIVIDENILIYEKNRINLKDIVKLQFMRTRVGGSKYDNCIALLTKDKRYIIRLNMEKKYLFIALLMKITKLKVEV